MKKRKLALIAGSFLLASGLLASCGNNDAPKEPTVSKASYSGINSTFKSSDTIDWSKFQVTVNYSDNSAVTFTSDKMEFDVDSATKSETELIVKTDGLHAMEGGALTEKRYYVTVAVKKDFSKFYDAGSIAVGDVIRERYDLIEYAAPRFMASLETVKNNAGKADEGAFKQFNDDFTVGTLNPWIFEPVATFMEKGKTETDDLTNYEKDVKLYVVEGTNETEVSPAAYSRILLKDGTYQFATEDAGKRFKIVVSPKDFPKDFVGDDVRPVSFSFNVAEGMNIYNAKQLGVLNLTNLAASEFVGDKAYAEHLYDNGAGYTDGNGQGAIYLTSLGQAQPYTCLDLPRVWERFLIDNGVFTNDNIAKFRDVKGVYLQNDIRISTSDIPADYFIKDDDVVNAMIGHTNTGALRDECAIYAPTTANDLTISGNYFKLDSSEIPLCKNTTDGTVCDGFGGVNIASFPSNWDYQIPPGHANLFVICGPCQGNQEWQSKQQYDATCKPAVFKNMLSVGNTGKDISGAESDLDKKMKVTGLIFVKSSYAQTTMDNLIIQEYMIGLFGDHNLGQVTLDHPQQENHNFIKNSKVFDCSNSGIFNYRDGGLLVSNTVMKRFGGACLINAGISGGQQTDRNVQPNTTFTSDCEFENYVTGGEVYYAAVGATDQISAIQGFDNFFSKDLGTKHHLVGPEGNPYAGKMNVIALQMDGDGYVSATSGKYFGTMVLNSDSDKPLKVELGDSVTTKKNTALCKTEVDDPFTLDQEDPMGSAMAASAAEGSLLDMDLCLGSTYLSIVFKLF